MAARAVREDGRRSSGLVTASVTALLAVMAYTWVAEDTGTTSRRAHATNLSQAINLR